MRGTGSQLRRRNAPSRGTRGIALSLAACAVLLSLTSCDTAQSFLERDDVCRDQRAALRSYGDYFAQDILVGGVIGAAVGTVVGVATHQSTGTTAAVAARGFAVGPR